MRDGAGATCALCNHELWTGCGRHEAAVRGMAGWVVSAQSAAYWLARRVSRAVSATGSLIRAIRCGRPNLGSGGWGRPGIVAGNDHEVAQLSGAGFPASRFFVQEIRVGMSGESASTRPTWSCPG
jgi:hypothetical protein